MRTIHYRDRESSSGLILSLVAGAVAGFAAGVLVAQRTGGLSRFGFGRGGATRREEEYDYEGAEFEDLDDETLEERVLHAFENDPILSERAIDIGEVGDGIIELAGWVDAEDEAERAVTIARGVPGVETVINRLNVGEEEEMLEENARRVQEGDAALTEARWEGQGVGTGRRRQGVSTEADRHADPRVPLEDRWMNEEEAVRNAAEEIESIGAERRKRAKKQPRGDRAGGAPVAPTGVPKADHVAEPLAADQSQRDVSNLNLHDADGRLS